ncbi:hypothetical protein [Photobacterium leiognathi]|uniref:hypothetical protein n=1 Tax=Photobacterium leiognathi TaxID=553611 RepID=UPI0029810A36|nr:hypothetical protein [Photobacterium leiognathi]
MEHNAISVMTVQQETVYRILVHSLCVDEISARALVVKAKNEQLSNALSLHKSRALGVIVIAALYL